jgi:hypothetical protein
MSTTLLSHGNLNTHFKFLLGRNPARCITESQIQANKQARCAFRTETLWAQPDGAAGGADHRQAEHRRQARVPVESHRRPLHHNCATPRAVSNMGSCPQVQARAHACALFRRLGRRASVCVCGACGILHPEDAVMMTMIDASIGIVSLHVGGMIVLLLLYALLECHAHKLKLQGVRMRAARFFKKTQMSEQIMHTRTHAHTHLCLFEKKRLEVYMKRGREAWQGETCLYLKACVHVRVCIRVLQASAYAAMYA